MCTNCSIYRHSTVGPEGSQAVACEASHLHLDRPISRRRLLQMGGTGILSALTASAMGGAGAFASGESKAPHLVLMVLDGARPEFFDSPSTPHLQALIRSGTRFSNAFAGILEAETPAAHTAIGTGSNPSHNGIVGFSWGAANKHDFSLFDPVKINDGEMDSIIRQSGVPTIAERIHDAYRGSKVVALSGSKYYAADAIGGPHADSIMYFYGTQHGRFVPTALNHHPAPARVLNAGHLNIANKNLPIGEENHLAMQLAVDTFAAMRQQVTLINLPESDWPVGHIDGSVASQQKVNTLMHRFDQDLAMLQAAYRKAGVLDRTIFVIMGDHGMMPLERTVSATELRAAVEKGGSSIDSDAYSTGSFFWLTNPARAEAAAQQVARLKHPYIQSVYAKVRTRSGYAYKAVSTTLVRTRGMTAANDYLLSTFACSTGPDVAVLFAEGAGSEPNSQSVWKADHGGANWQAQHLPLVMAGPGIRSNHLSTAPARIIDVAPTVLQLMGASSRGMQGAPLAEAMTRASSSAIGARRAASRVIGPVVGAMQSQSKYEAATHR